MTKYWVDPPSGWQYGFPKVYDNETDPLMKEWLIANGYPAKDIEEDWFYVRQWSAEDGVQRSKRTDTYVPFR